MGLLVYLLHQQDGYHRGKYYGSEQGLCRKDVCSKEAVEHAHGIGEGFPDLQPVVRYEVSELGQHPYGEYQG